MSEIFRDRTEGALARRQELLRKRRDELVTMPHAIRRVIVARNARTAGALAMIASGFAMLIVAMSPTLAGYLALAMPGINPAVVSTCVAASWVLGFAAYAVSRARSEHRFAVEILRHVMPGDDLDHDIERLSHEHPDDVARRMAQRLEVRSAALPVAAAAFVVPATLIYIAHALAARGWPSTMDYELNLVDTAPALALSALAGLVVALLMARRTLRGRRVAPIAAVIAVATGAYALLALIQHDLGATWVASVSSVLAGAIALVNWRLRRERDAIETTDPAAGSELLTLRGCIAAVRAAIDRVRARVSHRTAVIALALAAAIVGAGAPILWSTPSTPVRAALPATPTVAPTGAPAHQSFSDGSRYVVTPTRDGRLRISVTIVDRQAVEIDGLSALHTLPANWKARATVRLETTELPGMLAVTPFPGHPLALPLHMGGDADEHRFSIENCNDHSDPTIGFAVIPGEDWPETGTHRATFLVEPALELATCR